MPLKLPAWCAPYIGAPYAKGGRTLEGADCIGFFLLLQRERHGRELPEYDGPLFEQGRTRKDTQAHIATMAQSAEAFASLFEPIEAGSEAEGDAVLLRMRGAPMHIAYVVRRGVMLHLADEASSCAEDYTQRIWEKRVVGFYRATLRQAEAS